MSKLLLITIVTFAALHACAAKAAKAPEPSPLEELTRKAQSVVNNVTQALGINELPDSKKIVKDIQTNAQTLATKVQEVVDKLKGEVKAHQPELDNVLKSVEQKLTEAATSLQNAAGPEATAKGKEIKANFDSGLKTAVEQIEKLVKAVEPDATKVRSDVEKAAKSLLDQIVEIGTNLQNEVKSTIEEHEKTHKQ